MRTRIKICGITLPEDAQKAAALGVDAIGLVFYPDSPRAVSIERAGEIVSELPPFVSKVGLFVNPRPEQVEAVLKAVAIDLLQFHGTEPADMCSIYGWPYIKAVHMTPRVQLAKVCEEYHEASGLLLDAPGEGQFGGTGKTFDWELVPLELKKPIIVAGGLDQNNVTKAIHRTKPYAVDVSSGVESRKGIKDADEMAAFIAAVKFVDCANKK